MDIIILLKTITKTLIIYKKVKKNNIEAKINLLVKIWVMQIEKDFFLKE